MLQRTLTFFVALTLSLSAFAQDPDPVHVEDRKYDLFTGGVVGLNFGTVTNIDLSPMLGYYINDYVSVGMGFTYQYYLDKRISGTYDPVPFHIYGGRGFARLHPIPQLFGYAEYEYLTYINKAGLFPNLPDGERIASQNVLVGAGYKNAFTPMAAAYLMVLYNLNETIYTPYSNPVIRVGFEIGLR